MGKDRFVNRFSVVEMSRDAFGDWRWIVWERIPLFTVCFVNGLAGRKDDKQFELIYLRIQIMVGILLLWLHPDQQLLIFFSQFIEKIQKDVF